MSTASRPSGRGRARLFTAASANGVVPVAPNFSNTTQGETPNPSITARGRGRGRGDRLRQVGMVSDPHWVVSAFTADEFRTDRRPTKPTEQGNLGKPVRLLANYFPVLEYPNDGLVYRYDIEMRNERGSRFTRHYHRMLYELWIQKVCRENANFDRRKVVYDNEKIILAFDQPLPNIDGNSIREEIKAINQSGRPETYQLFIKQVGQPVDIRELSALTELDQINPESNAQSNELINILQVLLIGLHDKCSTHADHIYYRSFFTLDENSWNLGLGKAVWQGFYSCLVPSKGRYPLLMNLDMTYSVFLKKQSFIDFLCEIMRRSPCGQWEYGNDANTTNVDINDVLKFLDPVFNRKFYDQEREFLLKHCRDLLVRSQRADRQAFHNIEGLGLAASRQIFRWNNKHGRPITVEDYYRDNFGFRLRYPSLPTLKVRNNPIVPMEYVDVEPVRVTRLTDEQRAMLCQISSVHPRQYCQAVQGIRENPAQQCFEEDPFSQALGIKVDTKMIEVSAQILDMPIIRHGTSHQVTGQQCQNPGVWNSANAPFHKATEFPDVWALINFSSWDRDVCEKFYGQLAEVARNRGIQCPAPAMYEEYNICDKSIGEILEPMKKLMNGNSDCGFLFVILPEDEKIGDELYEEIKNLCELESGSGLVTQMVKPRSARLQNPGKTCEWEQTVFDSILQQINTKLNGVNAVVDVPEIIKEFFIRDHRIMYVGIDLSHDALDSQVRCSIVAVVASADEIPNRYFKEIYVQQRPTDTRKESIELVVDLQAIMKSLIIQYDQQREGPPKAIVVFRDGISTSEFHSVFESELTAIRDACVELSPVYRPALTYIVVNKRHHTRFFPTDHEQNISAGTVIDSFDVTHPTTYNFFLNSHHTEKGTSRPTHYHVLYDDNQLTPNRMHTLVYYLCYTYARCTRSISIPAPVKYADLLAFRARPYTNDEEPSSERVVSDSRSRRIVLSPKLLADSAFFL